MQLNEIFVKIDKIDECFALKHNLHPFWWSTFEQEDNYNLNSAQLSQLNIQKKIVWATEHIWAQTQWFP